MSYIDCVTRCLDLHQSWAAPMGFWVGLFEAWSLMGLFPETSDADATGSLPEASP